MQKDEDFGEWYDGVLDRAEITDKRYPIKGMNVWLPYGWAIQRRIDAYKIDPWRRQQANG